jgi:hypothetical protein
MRSTENTLGGLWRPLFTLVLQNATVLAASILLFGAKGTIFVAYLVSLALIIRSIGLKYSRRKYLAVAKQSVSRLGRLVVIHSHHNLDGQSFHHTFFIRGKYFCAGCHGLALGTLLSLILPTAFLIRAIEGHALAILLASAPICFLPTILRCLTQIEISALFRFVSYCLLPIGSWIVIVTVHAWCHSWLLNVLILGLVVLGWNAGGFYLQKRNV